MRPTTASPASLGFAVAISLLLSHHALGPYTLALALLVGFAWVFVGVHFPSAVLAGGLLGSLGALLIHLFRRQIDGLADLTYKVQERILNGLRRHLHHREG